MRRQRVDPRLLLQVLALRYTQHQPFALPALREFLKVDHRGLEQILRGWAELRDVPGLAEVPDHSTIPEAAGRPLESGGPPTSFGGRCAARRRAA